MASPEESLLLRRNLISLLNQLSSGDGFVQIEHITSLLKELDTSDGMRELLAYQFRKGAHESVHVIDLVDFFLSEESSEPLAGKLSLHHARSLFHMLDDYSALCYSCFPGSYYHEKAVAKVQDKLAGCFFQGNEVTSTATINAESAGLRCVLLRDTRLFPRTYIVVFRGTDLGRPGKFKHNQGDLAADLEICDQLGDATIQECKYVKELQELLRSKALNEPGAQYIFTGHSLGGVLALLAAKYRPDCCGIAFAALAIKGGWATTLGPALLRTVNYFDQDDPYLKVYKSPDYGEDLELKEWLVLVPENKKTVDGTPDLTRMLSRTIKAAFPDKSSVSNGDLLAKVTDSIDADIEKITKQEHFASNYMNLMGQADASVTAAGVRLLALYCK